MQAQTYVDAFAARGVLLWREGDALRYKAPLGVLTPAVLERLKTAKSKLLSILPSSPPVVATEPPDTSSRSPETLAAFCAWAQGERDRLLATPGSVPELSPEFCAEMEALVLSFDDSAVADLVASATPGEWIGEHEPERGPLLMESPTTAFLCERTKAINTPQVSVSP
jgi:hypothetical protein